MMYVFHLLPLEQYHHIDLIEEIKKEIAHAIS